MDPEDRKPEDKSKGKDNPADLGTKSLTRDKIRKYMTTIGYIGEYLDMAEGPGMVGGDVRMARGKKGMDEERVRRIIQAVTMAVLVGLGEAVEDETREARQGLNCAMMCMLAGMLVIGVCMRIFRKPICAAAVFLKKKIGKKQRTEGSERRKGRKRKMAEENASEGQPGAQGLGSATISFLSKEMTKEEYVQELKRIITEQCESIESVTVVEAWLKRSNSSEFIDPEKLRLVIN